MNRLQYLLIKLAEEASEVSQMALKTSQFGLDEVYQEDSNKVRLHSELNDLHGIIHLLNDEFGFGYQVDDNAVESKVSKVEHYYKYSCDLGMVDKDYHLLVKYLPEMLEFNSDPSVLGPDSRFTPDWFVGLALYASNRGILDEDN